MKTLVICLCLVIVCMGYKILFFPTIREVPVPASPQIVTRTAQAPSPVLLQTNGPDLMDSPSDHGKHFSTDDITK